MKVQHNQAKSIFLSAVEIASAEARQAFVDGQCAGDDGLRAEVEEFLAHHQRLGAFLQDPARGLTSGYEPHASAGVEGPGTVIGPYKLLEQIGEGGFGLVFMAEQQQPVRRKVALKILKPGMDTRQVIARFEAERQALALMDHPNIAKVLDAGETASGRPHFVMELVRGVPITDYCDQNRLTTRERLELFAHVCQAVQHAHHKGIIHRDIKPSNVMVTLYDNVPVVKVIDFGIAKALGQQLTDKTLHTGFAQMIGTPLYMSPEQAQLSGLDIDTRSDIYSLGVLLYELLTGVTPFDKERLRTAGYDEMRRIIREEEPPKPSMRLSTLGQAAVTVSEQRKSDPKRLSQLLRGELDWIVMKTLEKDRNRRYETASALAADVQRYLHDEPVLACPPSAWYRFRKFTRRNRSALVIAACLLLVVTSLAGSAGWITRDQAARRAQRIGRAQDGLTAARTLLADNQPVLARQKLAEAKAEIGNDGAALGGLAAQVETLEAELERWQRFFNLLDRAHEAEFVDGRWQTDQAAPLVLGALAEYDVLERDDWRTRLEGGLLGKDQVEEVRRLGYEQLLWLADDVMRRRQDQRSGQPLSPEAAAQTAGTYLQKAETARPPTRAWYRLRATARQHLGQMELARADADLAGRTPPTMACDYYDQAEAAWVARNRDEAIQLIEAALRLEPRHFRSLELLGTCLGDLGRGPEDFTAAAVAFTGCIMVRPDYAHVYHSRGLAYYKLRQWDQALADFTRAIELDPKNAPACDSRGVVYNDLKQFDKALADCSKAIELDPKYAKAWNNRGTAYGNLQHLDQALADFTKAIELDPKYAPAWHNRGLTYAELKQWDPALADYTRAIELDPKSAPAWDSRGTAYAELKQWDPALADHTKAIELDPKNVIALNNRGNAYSHLQQWDQAIADLTKAIELDPKCAPPHYNLGIVLQAKNQMDKAIAEYRQVIALQKDFYAEAHCNLAQILLYRGEFSASLELHKRGHALGSQRKDWHYPSEQWVAMAERLVHLEAKLPDVLAGKATAADNRERFGLLQVCKLQRRYVAAVRLYADAFAADPKLADDLKAGHRYDAACFAALAAARQGTDADKLDDEKQSRLRQQALAWLRADLEQWNKRLEGGKPADRQVVRGTLEHWQGDTDLAGVRDADALKKLSAVEQKAWRELWADVAELLKKASDAN